eukprot:g70475.t1
MNHISNQLVRLSDSRDSNSLRICHVAAKSRQAPGQAVSSLARLSGNVFEKSLMAAHYVWSLCCVLIRLGEGHRLRCHHSRAWPKSSGPLFPMLQDAPLATCLLSGQIFVHVFILPRSLSLVSRPHWQDLIMLHVSSGKLQKQSVPRCHISDPAGAASRSRPHMRRPLQGLGGGVGHLEPGPCGGGRAVGRTKQS